MIGVHAPPALDVPTILSAERAAVEPEAGHRADRTAALVRAVLACRGRFGITRLGSITRLDRTGIPVMQAVRAGAHSNALAQGKGLDPVTAAASALMEALETWAGETIPKERLRTATAGEVGGEAAAIYAACRVNGGGAGWDRLPLRWIEGWNLLADGVVPVPAALVDTDYLYPSPHPALFPRTTTGLAAGQTLHAALLHAGLEVLERDAAARAARRPDFFDRFQLDCAAVTWPRAARLLAHLREHGFLAGAWFVPSANDLPVYWCHVIEADGAGELAPLPGEGFGCDFTHDAALTKALMEACQARATAIAGAREDITRRHYPDRHDREHLARWRALIERPARTMVPPAEREAAAPPAAMLDRLAGALAEAGAAAVIAVPLFDAIDPRLHVVRLVAPALRHGPHA